MSEETEKDAATVVRNPWEALREATPARIALGRAGTSLPTRPHLQFQLAHARARSAVHRELDVASLAGRITQGGLGPSIALRSRAGDRTAYLQRPDEGRRLDEASRESLTASSAEGVDVAIVIADGLSAFAVEENAIPLLAAFRPLAEARGWSLAPVSIVSQGRVAAGDEIGEILGARLVVVLIGERPGLSSPDSLGLYLTFAPRVGLTDESRNCISNVRGQGLSPASAARKLAYLMGEALARGLSGVALKDEEDAAPALGPAADGSNFLIRT